MRWVVAEKVAGADEVHLYHSTVRYAEAPLKVRGFGA